MKWVERVKEYFGVTIFKRLTAAALALTPTAAVLVSAARASTMGFFDDGPGRVVPMYGVPVTVGPPVVKYGPAPIPTTTVSPAGPGFGDMLSFDWGTMFPSWSPGNHFSMNFTAPDLGHMMPSFPKLFGMLAFVAYASLILAAICGLAFRGSFWYLTSKLKK